MTHGLHGNVVPAPPHSRWMIGSTLLTWHTSVRSPAHGECCRLDHKVNILYLHM